MVRLFYYFSEARLTRIAEAIRYKTGEQVGMTVAEMPDKIASIEGGGGNSKGFQILYDNTDASEDMTLENSNPTFILQE